MGHGIPAVIDLPAPGEVEDELSGVPVVTDDKLLALAVREPEPGRCGLDVAEGHDQFAEPLSGKRELFPAGDFELRLFQRFAAAQRFHLGGRFGGQVDGSLMGVEAQVARYGLDAPYADGILRVLIGPSGEPCQQYAPVFRGVVPCDGGVVVASLVEPAGQVGGCLAAEFPAVERADEILRAARPQRVRVVV